MRATCNFGLRGVNLSEVDASKACRRARPRLNGMRTVAAAARWLVATAIVVAAALVGTRSAYAENWTGNFDSSWSNSSNWAPFTPASSSNTALTFGAAVNYTSNNNLLNPFTLNSM